MPVHLLGDRVLDLDARVHLHEVVVALLVDEELDRARALVADRLREFHRRLAHFLAQVVGQERRGAIPR